MATGESLAMLPWFVRDYIAATRQFSLAERGAYTDLLFLSWEIGALPNDPARLARMISCDSREFRRVWDVIRTKFQETAGGLINSRLEEHRIEAFRRAQALSDTARQKALKRWHGASSSNAAADAAADAPAMPQQMPLHSPSNAHAMHPSPSPSPSEDPKNSTPGILHAAEGKKESTARARGKREPNGDARGPLRIAGTKVKAPSEEPEETRRKALKLYAAGYLSGEIVTMLQGRATAEQVEAWTKAP